MIKINNKKLLIIIFILTIIFSISIFTVSFGMQSYYKVDFSTGLVTATTLNVRCGPGIQYKIIATANKNQYIRVFAGIGDWYIVQVEGDYIGAVNKKYVKPIYPGNNLTSEKQNNTQVTSQMNSDELEVFNLINKERSNNGLQALKNDNEVQRIARIKAQDMVNSNYFSHQSPTYGSPFDMLKSFGVSYKSSGENIAGNGSNSSAVTAWMNSSGHRANILNGSYNYTGVGVVSSSKYGKIFVQMFIEK